MTKINIGGELFNVQIDGPSDAPALMLSNSIGCDLTMWEPQVEALSSQFRLVRYDSRGHGGSVVSAGSYSMQQLGRDALGILDALGIARADFVGESLGGMVGQWLLAYAPERIGRAILACTYPVPADPAIWEERIKNVSANGTKVLSSGTRRRWFSDDFLARDPDAVDRAVAVLEATSTAGYAGCCAAIRDMDLRDAIRAVKNPVLVIAGRHDVAAPPELYRSVAALIDGAQFRELEAAHLANIEAPDAFNAAVLDFLGQAIV